ncbi:MAG: T9SS type A sorting domain-containing protein [Bacteroidales bacterium]|nr:MAG: T9SS type A sorting domain-containing protein [Bacteroidales bacterium]
MKTLPLKITLIALLYCSISNAKVHTISLSGFTFSPNNLSVQVGDTIKWQWSEGSHTTTSKSIPQGASSWDSELNNSNRTFLYKAEVAGNYTYVCTPHENIGMTGSFSVSNPTYILNNTDSFFTVFPNPASTQIKINTNDHLSEIFIYNMIGNIVYEECFIEPSRAHSINISNLPTGLYIISVKSIDGKRKTQKFTKVI